MPPKASDAKLINLFLDMLAAEQGAGDNTLDAYRRDLHDFSAFLARAGDLCQRRHPGLRDYLADLDERGFNRRPSRAGCRRCGICFAFCSTSGYAVTIRRRSCPAPSAAAACPKSCRSPMSTAC